jgi:hypothetical protein
LRPAGFTQTRFDQINFSATTFPFGPVAAIGAHTYDGWFVGGGTEIALSGLFGLPCLLGSSGEANTDTLASTAPTCLSLGTLR